MDKYKEDLSHKQFWVFLFTAFVFSIAVRLIWVYQFNGVEEFRWNDQLMINTNDGFYYAEGARDIIDGVKSDNGASPVDSPLAKLTALLDMVLPFSFESILLYMPTFFGTLLVIPIMLIARVFGQSVVGFMGALLGGIVWSYYNRTMTGYYDTDMLTIVLPSFVLWGLILSITHTKNRYLFAVFVSMLVYQWWYPGAYSLNIAFIAMALLYTVYFERRNIFAYKTIIFMLLAVFMMPMWIKVLLAILVYAFFHYRKDVKIEIILLVLGASFIGLMLTGGIEPVLAQLKAYVVRDAVMQGKEVELHFFNVAQTVREAGQIPFETFANRISGHSVIFVLSLIGYGWMLWKHKEMLLAAPMLGLGFLAYGFSNAVLILLLGSAAMAVLLYVSQMRRNKKLVDYGGYVLFALLAASFIFVYFQEFSIPGAGLRFTVYAVPIMALSFAYLLYQVLSYIPDLLVRYTMMVLALSAALYPNIDHILGYRVPTVFIKDEVKVLDQLRGIATRDDYALAWWDYGYPIRYYADVNTLVDGAKHGGAVNYAVSYALVEPQIVSGAMARLAVEYTEDAYKQNISPRYMKKIIQDYKIENPNDLTVLLATKDIALPEKTREIYYYLPFRMLDIYPTVQLFSNLDLSTGEAYPAPFLFQSTSTQRNGDNFALGNGVEILSKEGAVRIGDNVVKIRNFITTVYDQNQKLHTQNQRLYPDGKLSVIYMKNYNRFLILDERAFNSTFIQLYVLENYDPNYFEPVILSPRVKVYRSKV